MMRPRPRPILARLLSRWAVPAPQGISPAMADLIAAFKGLEAALAEIDQDATPAKWNVAANLELAALQVLLAERPANIAEFHAKFSALIFATATDSEFHILRVLTDDARLLAEGGA